MESINGCTHFHSFEVTKLHTHLLPFIQAMLKSGKLNPCLRICKLHNNVERSNNSCTIQLSNAYVLRLHSQNMIHIVYNTMYDPLHYPTVPTITTAM
jgi:hypothetical protein